MPNLATEYVALNVSHHEDSIEDNDTDHDETHSQTTLTSSFTEPDEEEDITSNPTNLDEYGLRFLLIQHLSNAWGDKTAEFAFYLFLIEVFKTTLLPSALFGFITTGVAIVFSHWAGSLVDRHPKLWIVRASILIQKTSALFAFLAFLYLFHIPPTDTSLRTSTYLPYASIVLCGCTLRLSDTTNTIAVERDWATSIAQGSEDLLSRINTYLRRIDLLCQLVAPLFVSYLSAWASYKAAATMFAAASGVALMFELIWIRVVYDRFPVLAREDQQRREGRPGEIIGSDESWNIRKAVVDNWKDWKEYTRLPIFMSSLSISFLYLTVLSFDGTMLGFLKIQGYSDMFLAQMRGLCVITGLLGTLCASRLESLIGSVRAGNWSIWAEVVSLTPVVASFFLEAPSEGKRGANWIAIMLFGGMAASRVGLWSFDLVQTKQLQTALASHPRRNALTSLQFTMQNTADLIKYLLTMVLSQPQEFRWAALVSFCAVLAGAMSYGAYVRAERGHLIHVDCVKKRQ